MAACGMETEPEVSDKTEGLDELNNYEKDHDSDDNEEDDDDEEVERKIAELQKQISKNPYMYETHTELIKLLKELGELEKLREARQRMSEIFPLTEDLWLDWLRDEIPLATEKQERKRIEELFQRAVQDYQSVSVWLEYVQFAIGEMAAQDGINKTREVFEKALSAAGLHVLQGSSLWEAYREFENAILSGIMPVPGQVATKKQETDFEEQHNRIVSIFRRQVSIPLNDMEESFKELKEWLQNEVDFQTKQQYQKALEKYNQIKPFEEDLVSNENKVAAYNKYIDYEISHGTAARVICLFERSVKENCLEPETWIKYSKYLDRTLKDDTLSIPVYERSVRNCPWCSQLWSNYLLTLERAGKPHNTIKDTVDRALAAGFSLGSDYLQVWSTYCDYLRRRITWDSDHEEDLKLFRANIEKAVEHLYSFPDGDPMGSLRQFWANIEAKYCKNVTKGRELWNGIMTEGHGNDANMWLTFYQFERCHGDNKHCRKVLQRALNSVSDWPESIVDTFINFEREEGTLEQYEEALEKCNAQMERINERRKLAAEKEEKQKPKHSKFDKKQKTFERGRHNERDESSQFHNRFQKSEKIEETEKRLKKTKNKSSSKALTKVVKNAEGEKCQHKSTEETNNIRTYKRKREDDQTTEQTFKVPLPPPPGYKNSKVLQPPPGFKSKNKETDEIPKKIQKTDERLQHGEDDTNNSSCTAFVSNLAYDVDEDGIKDIFIGIGDVKDIRLIRGHNGKSKGYAYVEFGDELCVLEALKLDRTLINGRPMFVSKCEEKAARKPQFKYATELEKNKLFIKGLPFDCSKEDLLKIFSEHGKLKDVRLVTYRSGAPKGLAYIEYEDEQAASQAVIKMDGSMVGEHTISVAISNPPERKTSKKDDYVLSLGGGKKETEIRGKARTQIALVPRTLKTPAAPKPLINKTEEKSDSNEQSAKPVGKSNDDFRKMLLNQN